MSDYDEKLNVILVDDDKDLIEALRQAFELADINVTCFRNPLKALKEIQENFDGAIVTDVRMPEMDGLDFFKAVKTIDPKIPVIVMTGHADVPMVLSAQKDGVFDFHAKPIITEELISAARRACETRSLVLENRRLHDLTRSPTQDDILIGDSASMVQLREMIAQISLANVDILIEGETGTGKQMVARLIHKLSTRSRHRFVDINCAAISSDSTAEELFGNESTSHSQYRRRRMGKIEEADNGIVYLNKLESAAPDLQSQLLPVVENRMIAPIGSSENRHVDIRIIASSTVNLGDQVKLQNFRSDLYFRLNTIKIEVPPLRDRREDIPLLFAHFLSQAAEKFQKKVPRIKAVTRHHLYEHDWPGNVQELKNFAQTIILGISNPMQNAEVGELTLPQRVEQFEAATIRSALKQNSGSVPQTIKVLGIPRKTFYDKIKRHDIELKKYRV